MIEHDGHLRTRGKCRKHEPQASVFSISRAFFNVRSVLSQCNTRLMLLHLLYFALFALYCGEKNKARFFSVLYCDKALVLDEWGSMYYNIIL